MNVEQAFIAQLCNFEKGLKEIADALNPAGRQVTTIVQTINFSSAIQNTVVLKQNDQRIGYTFNNRSADIAFLAHDENNCSPTFFTYPVDSLGGVDYIPAFNTYKGIVRIYVNDVAGFGTITEYSYAD